MTTYAVKVPKNQTLLVRAIQPSPGVLSGLVKLKQSGSYSLDRIDRIFFEFQANLESGELSCDENFFFYGTKESFIKYISRRTDVLETAKADRVTPQTGYCESSKYFMIPANDLNLSSRMNIVGDLFDSAKDFLASTIESLDTIVKGDKSTNASFHSGLSGLPLEFQKSANELGKYFMNSKWERVEDEIIVPKPRIFYNPVNGLPDWAKKYRDHLR